MQDTTSAILNRENPDEKALRRMLTICENSTLITAQRKWPQMKRIVITAIISLMLILTSAAYSQHERRAANRNGNLRVIVDGFKTDKGFAKIGLCNSKETFALSEERAIIFTTARIVQGRAEHVFPGVPFGSYAASAYHDENGNGRLDKGAWGRPLELYGFSNNARGILSRPEYEKAAFILDKADMAVSVTVK